MLLLLPLLCVPAFAAEEEKEPEEKAGVEAKGEEKKGEEWEEVRHFFTGFGGVAIGSGEAAAEGETAATEVAPAFGIDYSYRVSKLFGLGAYFDYAAGTFRELLVGPALFIFPWEGLFFEVSPSLGINGKQDLFFVARVAVGYEFEITPHFLLGLYVAADGAVEAGGFKVGVVPGVTIGWGF